MLFRWISQKIIRVKTPIHSLYSCKYNLQVAMDKENFEHSRNLINATVSSYHNILGEG